MSHAGSACIIHDREAEAFCLIYNCVSLGQQYRGFLVLVVHQPWQGKAGKRGVSLDTYVLAK